MGESFSKKENNKKKAKKRQDKAQKMEERKVNNNKGKNLEDMMAYIDENGNLTSTPPPAGARKEINPEDILLGAAPITPEDTQRTGTVSFFNEKGYGFIRDDKTGENVFVHNNDLMEPVKERDRVTFEKVKTPRGFNAIGVKKIE